MLVASFLLWGCGGTDQGADPDAGVEAVGGEVGGADTVPSGPRVPPGTASVRLHLGDGGELLVAPCVDSEPRPSPVAVTDATGDDLVGLLEEFGDPETGIPARVIFDDGSADEPGGRIRTLRVALPESAAGTACDQVEPDAELEASGNEPFWHLRLDDGEVLYRTPEDQDGALFHDVTWTRLEDDGVRSGSGAWRMEALRDFVDGIEYLVLEISDTPCIDSMSGARYPWTATLDAGGGRSPGCAREGRNLPEAERPHESGPPAG
ncbi:MAG: hypothetical protein EA350_14505 [Gemmatimonadales bacterium]|nr:MAG: hypothetical protein EA350_14505 [Gemmatimonadales bacterium]